jgi:hypothetical protein
MARSTLLLDGAKVGGSSVFVTTGNEGRIEENAVYGLWLDIGVG